MIKNFCHSFETSLIINQTQNIFRVIFIDDGSKVKPINREFIDLIVREFGFVSFISLARNFGQHTAILVGIKKAIETSDIVGFMNVDQEDPPRELLKLIKLVSRGDSDAAISLRTTREKSFFRDLTSIFFHSTLNFLTGANVPKNCSTLRIYSSEAASRMLHFWSYNPYIPGMEQLAGLKINYIETLQEPRKIGRSSYSLLKRFKFAFKIILNFSDFPLRVVVSLGIFFCLLGIVLGGNIIYQKLSGEYVNPGYTSTMSLIIFFGGMQIFTLGVIGLYLGRVFEATKMYPHYIIKEVN